MRVGLPRAILVLSFVFIATSLGSSFAADASLKNAVVEGKFGTAIDAARLNSEVVKSLPAYKSFPLTVELWCKLNSNKDFNILVANEPKESADHWELYTTSNTGTLAAYLPGMTPNIINSAKAIADGRWHYVAMVLNGKSVILFVDGKTVARVPVAKKQGGIVVPGRLSVGKASFASGELWCDGAIDDLRLSNTVRSIREIPTSPLTADAHTIGLWSFNVGEGSKEFADASSNANPMEVLLLRSLSEIDRESYKAGPSPLDSKAETISLHSGVVSLPVEMPAVPLNGPWQLVAGAKADWEKPITAIVPGSVHTALYQAGVIPFPFLGRNQEIARDWSFKTYWYKKTFSRPPKGRDSTLVFHGICNRCTIWLNGKELGHHEGMFTQIEFPVGNLLQDNNTLLVKLDPAIDWEKTVVFNNSYGWHYSKFPPLGVWQSVEIRGEPSVKVRHLFVATRDATTGLVDLVATLTGPKSGWAGKLVGVIEPDNFLGQAYHFEQSVDATVAEKPVHLQFTVPTPQLWWPVDMGKPNLYKLKLAFLPAGDGTPEVRQTTFGIRTIKMSPVQERPNPRVFDWTFVVNGQPMFVKGTGWCTCDAMMDFSRARYSRLIALAANQHIQMLRAWGSGMVETDDFYDLCDRNGIMVMQEWPTAWNSHETQPFDILQKTVREGILRLRSHPSLAIYTGGNESDKPFGKAIDMMGRLGIELDGTREFHRGEPCGGSAHDYDVYWGGQHINHVFEMTSVFYGEFGIASIHATSPFSDFCRTTRRIAGRRFPTRAFFTIRRNSTRPATQVG